MNRLNRHEEMAGPGAGGLARAAVQITRQVDLPRVLHEIATQAREVLGARRAVAEISREVIGREPLRVISLGAAGHNDEAADLPCITTPIVLDTGAAIGRIDVFEADRIFDKSDESVLKQVAEIGAVAITNARLRAMERRTRGHAARLQELTAALSEAVTLTEVTAAVVHHLTGALDADGAVVTRCTEDGLFLEILAASDMPEDARVAWARFPANADVPLAEVARTGNAIFLESRDAWVQRYPHLQETIESSGHHANAIVPLVVQNRVIGSIGVAFCEPRAFDPDDRALAMSIARHCAFALDRARLFESELDARRRAESANVSKSEFLAVMSHELRTPLNAISGYAELMLLGIHGPITDEQREDLQRIHRSQRHLLGIINNLLDYAKIEGGGIQPVSESVRVLDVLEAVIPLVLPQVKAKELHTSFAIPRGLCAQGDSEKIEQIVLNLVANAVKFTPRTGAIVITAHAVQDDVEIIVSDTGSGIPADMRDHVFEPFVQLNSPVTSHTAGTGLGLAISRNLAILMHGEIRVESAEPSGARFILTLPRAGADDTGSFSDDAIESRQF